MIINLKYVLPVLVVLSGIIFIIIYCCCIKNNKNSPRDINIDFIDLVEENENIIEMANRVNDNNNIEGVN